MPIVNDFGDWIQGREELALELLELEEEQYVCRCPRVRSAKRKRSYRFGIVSSRDNHSLRVKL
jgi:hypothetical protein